MPDLPVLVWILAAGVAMMAVAMVGSLTLLLGKRLLEAALLPLVSLAAGSLLGAAFLHMIPSALETLPEGPGVWVAVLLGFAAFLPLEQLLHWHHGHRPSEERRRPFTYLILLGDTLHNFIGGLAVGGAFLIDVRLGLTTWLAAAVHEVPQELGDFSVLVHGGWPKGHALAFNVLSGAAFLVGGVLAWAASAQVDVAYLIPFAAGNFIYIAAADLVPEIKEHPTIRRGAFNVGMFLVGAVIMYLAAMLE